MVGGRNYRGSQFNRLTQGLRQPGSSFKLFVYLAGLENGYTPESSMEDRPINVGSWHPRDYTGKYKGQMSLRQAFAESINSIAVQLQELVGRGRVIEMAKRLGITSELSPDASLGAGHERDDASGHDTGLRAFGFRRQGRLPLRVTRVTTASGKVLYERKGSGAAQVLKPDTVSMMNNMLMAVVTSGTGKSAQIGRPAAGKTGTTSDYKDAWFIGSRLI